MKRFIRNTILYLLPIVIISIPIELLLRKIPNEYTYKKEYLNKHAHEIEVLILGSSHSYYGVDPSYFSNNTFNASHVSQTYEWDYEIYKKYKDRFTSLKTIILPVSYFSLLTELETNSEHWRIKNYLIYYNIYKANSLHYFTELFSNNVKVNAQQIYFYYILGKKNKLCSDLGWKPLQLSTSPDDFDAIGLDAAQRHTRTFTSSEERTAVLNKNVSILRNFIRSNPNIRIILFTPPAYKTYYDNLDEEQMKLMIETSEKLASEADNCLYLNLLKNNTFTQSDFEDADHLNESGTKKLSLMLNDIINNQ